MEVREADGMRLHRLGPAEDGGKEGGGGHSGEGFFMYSMYAKIKACVQYARNKT